MRNAASHRQGAQACAAADAQELAQLRDYFAARERRAEIPMVAIMDFASASARRQAEITRLEWADNDEIGRTGLVRDAKHPRHKEGNHRRFKFTPEAWAIEDSRARPSTSSLLMPRASVRRLPAHAVFSASRICISMTSGAISSLTMSGRVGRMIEPFGNFRSARVQEFQ